MFLDGLHEKDIFTDTFPFRIALNTQENFNYPDHWHNAVELVYEAEGSCVVNINNVDYKLSERDIFFISPGDVHSYHTKGFSGRRYFIQFDYAKLYGYYDTHSVKSFLIQSRMISCDNHTKLQQDIEKNILEIIYEYEKKAFAHELVLNARFLDIIALLQRNTYSYDSQSENPSRLNELSRLDKAFKYIMENYQNNIALKDVAAAAGFSEYHFSRVFKKIYGQNFHEFLIEYRIRKFESLLHNNDITITEAAHASGFNSIVTFNRIFKAVRGCTPTEYIKLQVK